MTIPDDVTTDDNVTGDMIPVDVRVIQDLTTIEQRAPDFGSCTSWTAPTYPAQPVQILPRRPTRSKAHITVQSLSGAGTPSIQANADISNPTAGQTLTFITLPEGVWSVNWNVIMSGTLSNTDRSNVQLFQGASVIAKSATGLNSGTIYPQLPVTVVIPSGGQAISLVTLAANVAAVYSVSMTATPLTSGSDGPVEVLFSSNPNALQASPINPPPSYAVFSAPYDFDWESQEPCYVIAVGGTAMVSVKDESWADKAYM